MGSEGKRLWSSKKNKIKTIKQAWNYKQLKMCSEEQIGSVCASFKVCLLDVCRVCVNEGRVIIKGRVVIKTMGSVDTCYFVCA